MSIYGEKIDKKWQKKWEKEGAYIYNEDAPGEKLYVLEMFSYPSGSKLHAGHWFNYGPTDSWARMKKMQGYNVFQPMGFDSFGLPAENYAIKTGVHPLDSTEKNIKTMTNQLKAIGAMFHWDHEVVTSRPEYYKWTQWLFLELFKKGLAYRKNAPVNFCPSCNTVLANEQVIDGLCERCESEVYKKDLTQWFFKITDYADELLDGLQTLDWPEKTKAMQKHWIGKSKGSSVKFKLKDKEETFDVFTTRVDTLFGVSYVVFSPENDMLEDIVKDEYKEEFLAYKEQAKKQTDIERQSLTREKTGVFTGSYAINPINNEEIPIWVGDYVLNTYGTGIVMAVPAHDERDFEFAKKYKLDIKRVIEGGDELPYLDDGKMINSDGFNGLEGNEAREKVIKQLQKTNDGDMKINYRLRDWLVSRQRYWGVPIPIVHCDECGEVPVPEEDLPIKLPYDVNFKPDGKSPLETNSDFINTTCPKCGGKAKREADTLDTFVCSSWYYLRYPDNKNEKEAFDKEIINRMLPVDKYVGGPEHAVMHLLYSRFITKVLRDMGHLNFDEPFKSLTHQGLILGPDGHKMSKSKGNTISPDDYIVEFGSDVFRLYLMFGFSYSDGGAWSDEGLKSIAKFVDRVERNFHNIYDILKSSDDVDKIRDEEKELLYWNANTIKGITEDSEKMQFNTAIARMMELTNELIKYISLKNHNHKVLKRVTFDFIKVLAPFAPHFAEEIWEMFGSDTSIFEEKWPLFEKEDLIKDEVEIAVQVNGKIKDRIMISTSANNDEIENKALNSKDIKDFIGEKKVVKVIVIKGRLVNIVVK